MGIAPTYIPFAEECLTTWLPGHDILFWWARRDSVTNIFLLKNFATPPRAQALRLSRPGSPNVLEYIVGEEGLEPSSLATLVPKTNAYTNSATCPVNQFLIDCAP